MQDVNSPRSLVSFRFVGVDCKLITMAGRGWLKSHQTFSIIFSIKTPKDSQVHEINRIRFNSGHRGGLQVVRLQSAEDSNGRTEPLMKRARIVETSSSLINSSSVQTSDQDQQGSIAASKPIAQKPVIHTVPRRPSPANNFAARWNLIGLILVVTVPIIF